MGYLLAPKKESHERLSENEYLIATCGAARWSVTLGIQAINRITLGQF
jgi:hypothetical protein